jgi:hypothetical protein
MPSQVEKFLEELANLHEDAAATAKLQKNFDRWIPAQVVPFVAAEPLPYGERVDPTDPAVRAARSHAREEMIVTALKTRRYALNAGREPLTTPPTASSREPKDGLPPAAGGQAPTASRAESDDVSRNDGDLRRSAPDLPLMRKIEPGEQRATWIWSLSQMLRRAWEQPDRRTTEWGAFLLLLTTRTAGFRQMSLLGFDGSLPPPTLFEEAVLYLIREADRARYCENPDCPARYFFAKRRSQKYCSPSCALPAQREFKRRWWAEHGNRRRQQDSKARTTRTRKKRGG